MTNLRCNGVAGGAGGICGCDTVVNAGANFDRVCHTAKSCPVDFSHNTSDILTGIELQLQS